MITVAEQLQIREAYYVKKKSMRAIAREHGHSRNTVKKAIQEKEPFQYKRKAAAPAPVLGPYRERLKELVKANQKLPRKQRYTSHKMYEIIQAEGYEGAESTVRAYVGRLRKQTRKKRVFIPLEYDPGVDMQMDWGAAQVVMAGQVMTVNLFILRWCYSRKLFVAAYPTARQECFMDGHVRAFHYFAGLPQRIIYDNLKTAVKQILKGRNRKEQDNFLAFRTHYVIDSQYCNPHSGHEKGGVESDVGYVQRNFLAGVPAFEDFEDLNAYLVSECDRASQRQIAGQPVPIDEAWQEEQEHIRPLPTYDYPCCVTREARLNQYSQVTYQTNRYSVPADQAYPRVTLRAYPFKIEVLYQDRVLATHQRSYEREQDFINPLHYLPLLEERPGAFEHARPIRQWRETWDPVYETLLAHLQVRLPSQRAIREFIRILTLHRHYPPQAVTEAVRQALACGCAHLDSVTLCLHQHEEVPFTPGQLDLSNRPVLANVGHQPLDLLAYDRLLSGEVCDD
jgi:transposase